MSGTPPPSQPASGESGEQRLTPIETSTSNVTNSDGDFSFQAESKHQNESPPEQSPLADAFPSDIHDDPSGSGDTEARSEQPPEIVQDEETRREPGYLETPIEETPPPAYSGSYSEIDVNHGGMNTIARVADDGRVNIRIDQQSRRLSKILEPALLERLQTIEQDPTHAPPPYIPPGLEGQPDVASPPLNIVIQIIGSRGDVQPFVALGKVLKEKYGHRVRLATHGTFKGFVEENGLEFFNIGGDPAELMAFMVKNPGLMPGMESLRSGDVGKRRKAMYEMMKGCWRSCYEAGDGSGVQVTDDMLEDSASLDSGVFMGGDTTNRPFVADAIIANPPSFAHIHCADRLGIPLHLMFTMPWSPTQVFPHPLANITSTNADPNMSNFLSYALVEMMTWQGLGDLVNRFRAQHLGLEPVSLMWAPGMISRLKIPYTYCWSPALIPKPADWGSHISIAGFYFLSLASNYTPPPDLDEFLNAGPPPVYIGFGSIVVDDPNAMTNLIFEAIRKTGVRALVSKGWGGLGTDELDIPDGVMMLGNCPHDWLFKRVSCVVHHGGAGTTAAGIVAWCPTVVVPFFGDQPFWGSMVARAGAGPTPIPHKQLTADNLAAAILEALKPEAMEKAKSLAARINQEKGTEVGAQCFHRRLDVDHLRCNLSPSRAAVWRVRRTDVKLSALAATVLADEGIITLNDLKLYRPCEYDTDTGPTDPISGGASALLGTIGSLMMGVADFPIELFKNIIPKSAEDSSGTPHPDRTIPSSSATSSRSSRSLQTTQSADINRNDRSLLTSESSSSSGRPSAEVDPPLRARTDPIAKSNAGRPSTSEDVSDHHGRSLTQALNGQLSHSRSGSRHRLCSPHRQTSSPVRRHRSHQYHPHDPVEMVTGGGKGVARIVDAGMRSPMEFTLGIAKGFHNAPLLYGDTVRKTEKITGFQSGLKAAGKELGYGFLDGVSGLVTQPVQGAKKEGMAGFFKGMGKGIGGLILKPGAGIWGIPGYTFKGFYKELQKQFGSNVQNYILASRTTQGYEDWSQSTQEERSEIIARWRAIEPDVKKKRAGMLGVEEKGRHLGDAIKTTLRNHEGARGTRIGKRLSRRVAVGRGPPSPPLPMVPLPRPSTSVSGVTDSSRSSEDAAYEEAIQRSIQMTSRGNEEEDRLVERALRASISELQASQSQNITDEEALQRAIGASVTEFSNTRHVSGDQDSGIVDVDEENYLREVLERSILDQQNQPEHSDAASEEELQQALEKSKILVHATDDEYQQALDESRADELRRAQDEAQAKSEEDIVMEYVKRQSLVEEQYLHSTGKAKDTGDDKDLEKAIQESLGASRTGGEGAGPSGSS